MSDPFSLGVSALGATTSAFNLLKGFADVRDATKVQALKFELMGLLLEAQEAQSKLTGEKRELEERIRDLEAWDREQQRYELVEVTVGVVAFALKSDAEPPEAAHKLCANCFGERRKGYLQSETRVPGMVEYLVCHACGSEVVVCGQVHPEHRGGKSPKAPSRGGAWGR